MHTGRAVLLHPAALRTPWHVALALAAREIATHLSLTLAAVAVGAVAVALLLLLVLVSAPLGAAFLAWILWRSGRNGGREARRLARRARRQARALGLRVVRGAEDA
jgi:hypothetical protein